MFKLISYDSGEALTPRRRSVRKSLRESFRRLRKNRLMQRRTASEPRSTGASADDGSAAKSEATVAEQPVAHTAPSSPAKTAAPQKNM